MVFATSREARPSSAELRLHPTEIHLRGFEVLMTQNHLGDDLRAVSRSGSHRWLSAA